MTSGHTRLTPPLSLAGRSDELGLVRRLFERAEAGEGSGLLLSGLGGIGRTRLADWAAREARERGFTVAEGRGYPAERAIPYLVFAEALDPFVRDRSPDAVTAVTRGAPELGLVLPSLRREQAGTAASDLASLAGSEDGGELRGRVVWSVLELLDRVRGDAPFLLVLDDLHCADDASLELLHFLARHAAERSLVLIGTVRDGEPGREAAGVDWASRLPAMDLHPLSSLAEDQVRETVARTFELDPRIVAGFARRLHRWSGGNPRFIREALEALAHAGHLRKEGGNWIGWTWRSPPLTPGVRRAVRERLAPMDPEVLEAAEHLALCDPVGDPRIVLQAGSLPEDRLLRALVELERAGLVEPDGASKGMLDAPSELRLSAPVRDMLYEDAGVARRRSVHSGIARALLDEPGDTYRGGPRPVAHHIVRSGAAREAPKAPEILFAAGREALLAHSDEEAVRYLEAALEACRATDAAASPAAPGIAPDIAPDIAPGRAPGIVLDLARSLSRLGRHEEVDALLREARGWAEADGGRDLLPELDRELGLAALREGRLEEALRHFDAGIEAARAAGTVEAECRLLLARAEAFGDWGPAARSEEEALAALELARASGSTFLRAAAHYRLLLYHTRSGPIEQARHHGTEALALAGEADDPELRLSVRTGIALLEGFTGNVEGMEEHLDRAEAIADELEAPLLRVRAAEAAVEHATLKGEWDLGIALAEEALALARRLAPGRPLVPLLVRAALLYLGRGEEERAAECIDEARALASGEGRLEEDPSEAAVLTLIGAGSLHLARGAFQEAISSAESGIELAERCGCVVWGVHRLLPIVAEAALHLRDLELAERTSARLREEAERFDHRLGLAWADACDALVAWLAGDVPAAAARMQESAENLELLADRPAAARLRRQLAGRLAEIGERDEAVRELRRVHDLLAGLGAEPELVKARGQFREVGARPPTRTAAPGTSHPTLTPRELEIARLAGDRLSNKAIAKALDVSPRTVGTHLSNVYKKLGVKNRHELGDLVRRGGLAG